MSPIHRGIALALVLGVTGSVHAAENTPPAAVTPAAPATAARIDPQALKLFRQTIADAVCRPGRIRGQAHHGPRRGSGECNFESKSIAGVGVMFYVLLALRAELRTRAFPPKELAEFVIRPPLRQP